MLVMLQAEVYEFKMQEVEVPVSILGISIFISFTTQDHCKTNVQLFVMSRPTSSVLVCRLQQHQWHDSTAISIQTS